MAKTRASTLISILVIATVGFTLTLKTNGHDFPLEEANIDQIQRAFTKGKLTSRQLVEFYLIQIKTFNPLLRGVLEVNPDALDQADVADRERELNQGRGFPLGPLHGIPVLLKDGIDTNDKLNTTAGSYALLGSRVARDAGVVEKLRNAGAVILGKTSMTEWYNFRAMGKAPNGWCARGGQGNNPYVLSGDPCGSSSGSAISVAANMVTVSLGSETHGSILCPSDHNSVVGFKPTVGLTSRAGVIPVYPPHDTVGPIARTVSDAVYVLDAIVGFDPRDEETREAAKFIPPGGYKQFLNEDGLSGKRLGVVRKIFSKSLNGSSILKAFEKHLDILRRKGAIIVDDLEIKNLSAVLNPGKNGEKISMLAGFKVAINEYLQELVSSPVRSLAEVINFIKKHPDLEKTKEYGQETFIESEKTNGFGEKEKQALELMKKLAQEGFVKLMTENELDALVTPGTGAIGVLAVGGYPGITVPSGYNDNGMPFGIIFGGLKGFEPKLIEIAYAFEQATMIRRPPSTDLKDELLHETA